MIRVLVVDDNAVFRQGMRQLFDSGAARLRDGSPGTWGAVITGLVSGRGSAV